MSHEGPLASCYDYRFILISDIIMKVLKTLNGKGVFMNDSIWKRAKLCLLLLCNNSEDSVEIAKVCMKKMSFNFFSL